MVGIWKIVFIKLYVWILKVDWIECVWKLLGLYDVINEIYDLNDIVMIDRNYLVGIC